MEVTVHAGDAGHCTPSVYRVWSSRSKNTADFWSQHQVVWWPRPLQKLWGHYACR